MLFCLFSFIVVYSRRLSKKMLLVKNINDEGRIYRKECYPLSRSHSS